jgi:hypothetical protein
MAQSCVTYITQMVQKSARKYHAGAADVGRSVNLEV